MFKTILSIVIISATFLVSTCVADVYTKMAVIHHSVSQDVSVETIRKWHVEERGWDDIGYHFVIRKDGTIEKGRPLWKNGAHARGRNNYVGICLTGNNAFTNEQLKSLLNLLDELGTEFIESHHRECPGPSLRKFMLDFNRDQIGEYSNIRYVN